MDIFFNDGREYELIDRIKTATGPEHWNVTYLQLPIKGGYELTEYKVQFINQNFNQLFKNGIYNDETFDHSTNLIIRTSKITVYGGIGFSADTKLRVGDIVSYSSGGDRIPSGLDEDTEYKIDELPLDTKLAKLVDPISDDPIVIYESEPLSTQLLQTKLIKNTVFKRTAVDRDDVVPTTILDTDTAGYVRGTKVKNTNCYDSRIIVQTVPQMTKPTAPRFLRIAEGTKPSGGGVNMTWGEPDDLGGATSIVKYALYVDGVEVYRGSENRFFHTGLEPNNKEYEFCVAVLTMEEGQWSDLSPVTKIQTDAITPPGSPIEPFQISATQGSMTVGWSMIREEVDVMINVATGNPAECEKSISSLINCDRPAMKRVGKTQVEKRPVLIDTGGSPLTGWAIHIWEWENLLNGEKNG